MQAVIINFELRLDYLGAKYPFIDKSDFDVMLDPCPIFLTIEVSLASTKPSSVNTESGIVIVACHSTK